MLCGEPLITYTHTHPHTHTYTHMHSLNLVETELIYPSIVPETKSGMVESQFPCVRGRQRRSPGRTSCAGRGRAHPHNRCQDKVTEVQPLRSKKREGIPQGHQNKRDNRLFVINSLNSSQSATPLTMAAARANAYAAARVARRAAKAAQIAAQAAYRAAAWARAANDAVHRRTNHTRGRIKGGVAINRSQTAKHTNSNKLGIHVQLPGPSPPSQGQVSAAQCTLEKVQRPRKACPGRPGAVRPDLWTRLPNPREREPQQVGAATETPGIGRMIKGSTTLPLVLQEESRTRQTPAWGDEEYDCVVENMTALTNDVSMLEQPGYVESERALEDSKSLWNTESVRPDPPVQLENSKSADSGEPTPQEVSSEDIQILKELFPWWEYGGPAHDLIEDSSSFYKIPPWLGGQYLCGSTPTRRPRLERAGMRRKIGLAGLSRLPGRRKKGIKDNGHPRPPETSFTARPEGGRTGAVLSRQPDCGQDPVQPDSLQGRMTSWPTTTQDWWPHDQAA